MSTVRAAQVGDADAMGALHVRAWQVGYADAMPADYLAGLQASERAAMWRRGIEAGTSQILVATDDAGGVVGFACFGAEREADHDRAEAGELYALNVEPDAWGAGHGGALLAAATDWLATHWTEAVLWVLDTNERAQRLYAHAGWRDDGARRSEEVLGAVVAEVRFRRSLR
jgi:RimJ/RimL family protein N-acetyltransferase